MHEQSSTRIQQLEKAAVSLPGIRRVRADESSGRLLVRVLVAPERTDEEASRMLRDLAAQRLGIEIREDAIEILRTGEAPTKNDGARRRLMSLTTERLENRFIVRVVLELTGDLLMGDSAGVAKRPEDERHLVSEAVVNALADVLDFKPVVDSVDWIYEEGVGLALVALESDSRTLIGVARVRHNEHDAIARATLNAINRAADLTSPSAS
ncbi:MAG: hypothetical protein M3277_11160 [Actinomycetota bacterium]|nr:hypothetical protein [Actinomycetota bacterium]